MSILEIQKIFNISIFRLLLIGILGTIFTLRLSYQRRNKIFCDRPSFDEEKLLFILVRFEKFILLLYIINPQWLKWSSFPLPEEIRWFGVGLGILCIFLFIWVHKTLGKYFTDKLIIGKKHQLIIEGAYQRVRHPMYTAFFLLIIAIFLITSNWFIGLIGLIHIFLVTFVRVPKEEEMMINQFGQEYRTYIKRTGRFLPRIF